MKLIKYFFLIQFLEITIIIAESICQTKNQDHCDIIDQQKKNENESENNNEKLVNSEILKILKLSDDHVNMSLKWNYVTANNSKINDSEKNRISDTKENLTKIGINEFDGFVEKNNNDQDFITKLSGKLLSFSQPFDPSRSPSASQACREHTRLFLNSLKNLDLWALRLHDSSARLTSGILNGNINQYGDFDQCLAIQGPLSDLQGQYCLAYLQPKVTWQNSNLKHLLSLVQSHNAFSSNFNDAGHRVPRFSMINWGICVPSSCSPYDVEYSLKEYIRNLTADTGIEFEIRVEPQMCQANKETTLDQNTKLAIGFFLFIILVSLTSTLYDYNAKQDNKSEWLISFSLRKNMSWLFNTKKSPGDIPVIHGIRFFNALMLLFSHKSMATFFDPYINRTDMAETLGQPWTVVGRAASIYTDPFLMFSGMLTSYALIGRLQKGQSVKLKSEYVGRFLRIVPSLGALILFCTYILPLLGSGPQWNLVVGHHSELCKKYWWRNLLFIHNYFGFKNMCLTHTHHIGIDTELFLFAPIMILGLWKWPRKGLFVLIGLAGLGTAGRFYTTIVNELSNYVYYGTTIQRLFKTADYMYSFPPYRSTVYILGILLGYALRVSKDIKLSKSQYRWGSIISILLYLTAILGPAPMGSMNYKYKSFHAACYAAFAPLAWCAPFAWIVFISHLGYKNSLTYVLSWKYCLITTRLSYAIYLTQFPVFFYNVGKRKHNGYYNFFNLMTNTNEYFCIYVASIMFTILFDKPFQNIKQLLFKSESSHSKPERILEETNKKPEMIFYSEKDVKNILD